MKRAPGFTLVEILLAMVIIVSLLFAFLLLNQLSVAGTADAYAELSALSVAREPLEVFQGLGYQALTTYAKNPLPAYPLGEAAVSEVPFPGITLPVVATRFRRQITLELTEDQGMKAARVVVQVTPVGKSWLSRDSIRLEALVPETPP